MPREKKNQLRREAKTNILTPKKPTAHSLLGVTKVPKIKATCHFKTIIQNQVYQLYQASIMSSRNYILK